MVKPAERVDILFDIDNSRSMSDKQEVLTLVINDLVLSLTNPPCLEWDPQQTLVPPGEGSVDALTSSFKNMVTGVGQIGCGYESQLESWYRFLIDPEPYESISVVANKATPMGIDSVLLKQRADFLRPDSLLAQYACIMKLNTPRDCSNPGVISCDCVDQANDSPLCTLNPNSSGKTLQVNAKAYPGIRELSVLKGLGDRGVTASICAAQTTNVDGADYAYLPAVRAFAERATPLLQATP